MMRKGGRPKKLQAEDNTQNGWSFGLTREDSTQGEVEPPICKKKAENVFVCASGSLVMDEMKHAVRVIAFASSWKQQHKCKNPPHSPDRTTTPSHKHFFCCN